MKSILIVQKLYPRLSLHTEKTKVKIIDQDIVVFIERAVLLYLLPGQEFAQIRYTYPFY